MWPVCVGKGGPPDPHASPSPLTETHSGAEKQLSASWTVYGCRSKLELKLSSAVQTWNILSLEFFANWTWYESEQNNTINTNCVWATWKMRQNLLKSQRCLWSTLILGKIVYWWLSGKIVHICREKFNNIFPVNHRPQQAQKENVWIVKQIENGRRRGSSLFALINM